MLVQEAAKQLFATRLISRLVKVPSRFKRVFQRTDQDVFTKCHSNEVAAEEKCLLLSYERNCPTRKEKHQALKRLGGGGEDTF